MQQLVDILSRNFIDDPGLDKQIDGYQKNHTGITTLFLAQLKRLNLYKPDSSPKAPRKVIIKMSNREEELEIG